MKNDFNYKNFIQYVHKQFSDSFSEEDIENLFELSESYQALEFVFVAEVAPQHVIRTEAADRLEGQRLQPPGLEGGVVVMRRVFHVDLHAGAQLVHVLVKGRLEPAFAQHAAAQPVGGQRTHVGQQAARVDVGRTEQLQRARGAAAFAQSGAFQHHGAGIGARHAQVGGVGAGIDPRPFSRPAEAGRGVGLPALHGDDAVFDIELEQIDEPVPQLTHRHAMAHGHRAGADEALPAVAQRQPFHRAAGGVGAVDARNHDAALRAAWQSWSLS